MEPVSTVLIGFCCSLLVGLRDGVLQLGPDMVQGCGGSRGPAQ